MPTFFSARRGTTTRYISNYTSPFAVSVDGNTFSHALIQNVSLDHEGSYQFQHALDNAIYIYVFGDRIGTLTVSGKAFMDCYGQHGLNQILTFYNSNRLAARSTPVRVVLGQHTFFAFITGLRVDMSDPETLLANFSIRLAFFPSDSNSQAVRGSNKGTGGSTFSFSGGSPSGQGEGGEE